MSDELIPTKEVPGPYDALSKARPDEPIFTLIGRDKHAPATILHWVSLTRQEAFDIREEAKVEEVENLLRKASDAELIAWGMASWRDGHAAADDLPMADYYGIQPDKTMLAEQELSRLQLETWRRTQNSIAELTEAADAMNRFGRAEEAQQLATMVAGLKAISAAIKPQRT